jgi:hypothetical protein
MDASLVTICRTNSDYSVGFAKGLAVAYWRYNTFPEYVAELEAAALRAHKASGHPIGLIQIAPASASNPDARCRSALARMLHQLNGIVSHSAIVHEAEGFRAATVRSIVTCVAALSSFGFPHRVFAKVPEAAAWMSRENERLRPLHITSTVNKVRAAIPAAKVTAHIGIDRAPQRNP